MKTILPLCLLVLLAAPPALMAAAVAIAPTETVVVRYHELIEPGLHAPGSESDRFHYLTTNLEKAFAEAELAFPRQYERAGFRPGDETVVVEIFLHRWFLNRIGEYEIRFGVNVRRGRDKEKLGIFVGRKMASGILSTLVKSEEYQEAAYRAGLKLAEDLDDLLATETNADR